MATTFTYMQVLCQSVLTRFENFDCGWKNTIGLSFFRNYIYECMKSLRQILLSPKLITRTVQYCFYKSLPRQCPGQDVSFYCRLIDFFLCVLTMNIICSRNAHFPELWSAISPVTLSSYRHGKHKSGFAGSSSYSTTEDAGEDLGIGSWGALPGFYANGYYSVGTTSQFLLRFWRTLVFLWGC